MVAEALLVYLLDEDRGAAAAERHSPKLRYLEVVPGRVVRAPGEDERIRREIDRTWLVAVTRVPVRSRRGRRAPRRRSINLGLRPERAADAYAMLPRQIVGRIRKLATWRRAVAFVRGRRSARADTRRSGGPVGRDPSRCRPRTASRPPLLARGRPGRDRDRTAPFATGRAAARLVRRASA
jgi:hypothetical protein